MVQIGGARALLKALMLNLASHISSTNVLVLFITPTHHSCPVFPFLMWGLFPNDVDPKTMKAYYMTTWINPPTRKFDSKKEKRKKR